jgi:hypothetical protein
MSYSKHRRGRIFPLINIPVSATWDIIIHVIIVGVEHLAFIILFHTQESSQLIDLL